MKKLSLNLDELSVESFSTRPGDRVRGTVAGQDATAGGAGCGTDNWGSWCCWGTDTQCGGTDGDTWCCQSPGNPGSGAPSCGNTCGITGIPYKCADGCGSIDC